MVLFSDAKMLLKSCEYFAVIFDTNSKMEPDLRKIDYFTNDKKLPLLFCRWSSHNSWFRGQFTVRNIHIKNKAKYFGVKELPEKCDTMTYSGEGSKM